MSAERRGRLSLVLPWAVALLGLGWAALDAFAAGKKTSGSTEVVDDLTHGSAGTAQTTSGSTEVAGSLGQIGNITGTSGATTVDGGYFNFPASAGDTVKIWAGGSGLASAGANWIGGVAPVSGDYVIFGATGPTVSCSWDLTVTLASVTVNSSYKAIIFFDGQLTVNGPFEALSLGATVNFTSNASNKHQLLGPVTVSSSAFHIGGTTVVAIGSVTVAYGTFEMHDKGRFEGTKLHVYPGGGGTFKLYDDTAAGAPVLTSTANNNGARLQVLLDNRIDVSTGVFGRLDRMGLQIGDIATFVNFSSFTISGPLEPGTTAINFDVPGANAYVSTFTNINFADPNILVNVDATNLSAAGTRLTLQAAKGAKAGPSFEYDPNGKVDWLNQVFGVLAPTNLATAAVTRPGAAKLTWTWPETLAAGASFYIQYSTNSGANWQVANAQVVRPTGPVTVSDQASYIVGGLDTGRNASDTDISPVYYFRLFVSSGVGAESGPSNTASGTGALPPPLGTNFANFGGPGTPGGGWLSTVNDSSNSGDGLSGVARDGNGNVYVHGTFNSASSSDTFVRKYDSAGNVAWTKYFNGEDDLKEESGGLAADLSGNVYAVGESSKTGESSNVFARKYDASGTLLWESFHNGPDNLKDSGAGVAVDSSGNVLVSGHETKSGQMQNVWLRKYNAAGLVQWTTSYNGPNNGNDEGSAVAVDNGGSVYVAGLENTLLDGDNIWVRKYDPSGLVVWTTTYNGVPTLSQDEAQGIAVDSVGNVYVSGNEATAAQGDNIWVRKYDSATPPNTVWTHTFNGSGNADDFGHGIAVNETGVFFTGEVNQGSPDILVRKLALNSGLALWTTTYNGSSNSGDDGKGIAVDGSTNVYVAGHETVLGQMENGWLRRFNADALLASIVDLSTSVGPNVGSVNLSWFYPEALGSGAQFIVDYSTFTAGYAFDAAKAEVKVTTGAVGAGTFQNFTVGDLLALTEEAGLEASPTYYFRVFLKSPGGVTSPASNLQSKRPTMPGLPSYAFTNFGGAGTPGGGWLWTINGGGSGNDRGFTVPVANSQNGLFVMGHYFNGSNNDGYLQNFDLAGSSHGNRFFNNGANTDDFIHDGALDPSEQYGYLVGKQVRTDLGQGENLVLYKLNLAQGLIEWTTTYNSPDNLDDSGEGVFSDGSSVYVTGYRTSAGQGKNVLVQKYDAASANLLWSVEYNGADNGLDQGHAIASDGPFLYVAGEEFTSAQGSNLWLRKYDLSGLAQWTTTYNGPGSGLDRGLGVAADPGGIFVTGEQFVDAVSNADLVVQKYDSSAGLLWHRTYNSPANGNEAGNDIAVQGSGVYVGGREGAGTGTDILVRKYGTGGLLEWTTTYAGPGGGADEALGVSVDAGNHLYVAGFERKSVGQQDNLWLRRFNADAFQGASAGTTKIWAGINGGLASVGSNWIGGFAPVNGDYVVFGATNPANYCTWDLNIALSSITFKDGYSSSVGFQSAITVDGPFEMVGPFGTAPALADFIVPPGLKHVFKGPVTISTGIFHVDVATIVAIGSVTIGSGFFDLTHTARFEGTEIGWGGGPGPLGRILMVSGPDGGPIVTSTSPATRLVISADGTVDIATGTFRRLAPAGLQIGAGAVIVKLSSFTFEGPLAPGSTAINFDGGGSFTSTFTNVNFQDPNIAVNVRANLLSGGRITMRDAQGPAAGPSLENDPSGLVDWPAAAGSIDPVSNLAASNAGVQVGGVKLSWTWPSLLSPGSVFKIQYATFSSAQWDFTQAQVTVSTGPTGGAVTHVVGGLDVGVNAADADISPSLFFRIFAKDGPGGVFSQPSNTPSSRAALPPSLTNSFVNLGGPGTPGGGWKAGFNHPANAGDKIRAVARDGSGNIYASGDFFDGNSLNIVLRKYDPNGTILWSKFYNSPADAADMGHGVSVEPSGVYLTGSETRGDLGQGQNLFLAKYDSNGLLQWTTSYNGPNNGNDEALGVSCDGSGVFVAGYHTNLVGQGGINVLVRKYTHDGLLAWTTEYTSAGSNIDQAQGVKVSGSDLYVTGYESPVGNENIWTRRYNPANGLPVWTQTYDSPAASGDRGAGVAADGAGVFVAGHERRTDLTQGDNIWVRKHAPADGSVIWTSTFNGPANGNDTGAAVAVEAGQVFVTGKELVSGQSDDVWVRKLAAADGLVQWTTTYNNPANLADSGQGVAVDTAGAVYVGGYETASGEGTNGLLRKFNADAFGGGTGGGAQVFVQSVPQAPAQLGASESDRPMMALKLWTGGGSVNLNAVALSLFGDAPAAQVSASVCKDGNADGDCLDGGDEFLGTLAFAAGAPPKADIPLVPYQTLTGTTQQYLVRVSYSNVPAGKRLEVGLDFPADLELSAGETLALGFPHKSGESRVVLKLSANPSSQSPTYAVPGAPNAGGLDTGLYLNSGQQVNVDASGSWHDGAGFFGPDGNVGGGNCGSCVVTSTASARLIGRVGSGNWFALGMTSTVTASGSGNLFLAMNDDAYTNNSGSVTVSYRTLAATGAKVWIGGSSSFPNKADFNGNWAGGQKPFNGEAVVFGTSTFDCQWDLPNLTLSSLVMTTDYVKVLRLVSPSGGGFNNLTVSTHVTLARGTFDLGNGGHSFEVQGLLVMTSSATLDMGAGNGSNARIKTKGLTLRGASTWRNAISTSGTNHTFLENVPGGAAWPFIVENATVSVTGHGPEILNSSEIVLTLNAKVNNFDFVTVDGSLSNAAPSLKLFSTNPLALTLKDWEFLAPHVSTNVDASALPAGSVINFINASGGRFGTPFEKDPNNLVVWNPDGGGAGGTISGNLSYSGTPGNFRVLVTTVASGAEGGISQNVAISSGPGGYSVGSLQTPNTWYVFWFKSAGTLPSGNDPRGGFGHPGSFISEPVFLGAGGTNGSIVGTASDWGAVSGNITLNTTQTGPLRIEAWKGDPPCGGCTLENAVTGPPAGGYFNFSAPQGTGFSIISYVDVDNDKVQDAFEAVGSSSPVQIGATEHSGTNITVSGGSAQSGGVVSVTTAAAHGGALTSNGTQPVLKLRLHSASANSTLNAVKVEYAGVLPNSGGVYIDLFVDSNDDGIFQFGGFTDSPPGADGHRGSLFAALGASSGTIAFNLSETIAAGATRTFFLNVDPAGNRLPEMGVKIATSSAFGLAAGAMSSQAALYPIVSTAPVRTRIPADAFAYASPSGGFFTGLQVFAGQQVSISASGSWNPGSGAVGPDGAGATGLNTVLPPAKKGELIGRVNPFGGPMTQWFRVGLSTTVTASGNGELVLAMNDTEGSYGDNTGGVLADFSVAGSTLGALQGTVSYSGGSTGSMEVRAIKDGIVKRIQTLSVGAPTSYSYSISGLEPGAYSVFAQHLVTTSHNGDSVQTAQVAAGSTATLNVTVSLGAGSITGFLSYAGVQTFGNFLVAAATHTDFEHNPVFFATASVASAGCNPCSLAYTLPNLQTPRTYFVVAFRDGNNDFKANGPEAFGYFDGNPGSPASSSPISGFSAALAPIVLGAGGTAGSINIRTQDKAFINGNVTISSTAVGGIVVEAGRGTRGSPGYLPENRQNVSLPNPIPPGGVFYSLDLLRPATDYQLFAFLDSNFNAALNSAEPFFQSGFVSLSSGSSANLSFALTQALAPAPVSGFQGTGGASQVVFTWNTVSGANGYELRDGAGSVIQLLGSTVTTFTNALSPNTASAITRITASNANGTSPNADIAPVFSLANPPASPSVDSTGQTSAVLSWGANSNPAGTVFELHRATGDVNPGFFFMTATTTALSRGEFGLSAGSTYFWKLRARNGNSLLSAFSATVSGVTNPATIPSIAGTVNYGGKQSGFIVIEANTAGDFSAAPSAKIGLTSATPQNYFLPLSGTGSFYVRGFMDVTGDNFLTAGEDKGFFGSPSAIAVAGPETGKNFSISVDTVAPGSPAGLSAALGVGQVALTWSKPLKSADGSALSDLFAFRVERSTGGPFVNLTPGRLSSATLTFTDFTPLPGIQNSYRVAALDFGLNLSSPTAPVSVTPSAGGTISGTLSTFTATTAGVFRVRLSSSPEAGKPFLAEINLGNQGPYSFTGLSSGTYFVRAFRDVNSDSKHGALNEPAGTFGGINQPYSLYIFGGNSMPGNNVPVCDRTQISPNTTATGSLAATDCPAKDKGQGFVTDLYAFEVGGGASGSVGINSDIELALSSSYDNELILIDPSGSPVMRDNRLGGASIRFTVFSTGVYLVEPTSFNPGAPGAYSLSLNVRGGFAGSISGTVGYEGGQLGSVKVQLFNSASPGAFPINVLTLAGPGPYSFPGLLDGTYYARAFRDSNGDGIRSPGEAAGAFGPGTSPTAITITGGIASVSPVDLTLTDPSTGRVEGGVFYDGGQTGPIRIEVGFKRCDICDDLDVKAIASTGAANSFGLSFLSPATHYVVRAFVDSNGNRIPDTVEPKVSSSPVNVVAGATTTVNLLILDHGAGSSGDATLQGTIGQAGTAGGTVFLAFAKDNTFQYLDYVLNLNSTGTYVKAGLQGNATYFMVAFRDTNGNSNFDFAQEPEGVGAPEGFTSTPTFSNPPQIFVSLTGITTAHLTLKDPPNGQIQGQVSFSSTAFTGAKIILEAEGTGGPEAFRSITINRLASTTHYLYTLGNLPADTFQVRAFVDTNGNTFQDFGEPFGSFTGGLSVTVSTGAGSSPFTGVIFPILEAGQIGGGSDYGSIEGAVSYSGAFSSGPIVVRVFNASNPAFVSVIPEATVTVPAPTATGTFFFTIGGLPLTDYAVDAFRDTTFSGNFNAAYQPYGKLKGGAFVTLSANQPFANIGAGTILDPGSGVSGTQSISGTLSYAGTQTCAVAGCRIRSVLFPLGSNTPVRFTDAAFGAVAAYTFDNLTTATPTYRSQHFGDLNNNFFPDPGEPVIYSTATGIPLGAVAGLSGQNYQLCDRQPLTAGVDVFAVHSSTDCAAPDRGGAFQKLFTFQAKRGQPVTIQDTAIGFTDSYLTLYDPLGNLVMTDDESAGDRNARITGFAVPADGDYTVGASPYDSGITGSFKLSQSGSSGGSLGSIAGAVTYTGSQGGNIVAALFNSPSFGPTTFVEDQVLIGTRNYTFGNLLTGASYYLGAFVDVNGTGFPDPGEEGGRFGGAAEAAPVFLQNGQDLSGVDFSIDAATTVAANFGFLTGQLTYSGTQLGASGASFRVELWTSASFTGAPAAVRDVFANQGPGSYAYDLGVPGGAAYFIRAFVDLNANFLPDSNEPRGLFSLSGQGADSIFVPAGGGAQADITVKDPFLSASGQIAGEGTASLSAVNLAAGAEATLRLTYTVGAAGMASGAKLGLLTPPGFSFPYTVTAATVTPAQNGPSLTLTLNAALASGALVNLDFKTVAPCFQGFSTFTVVSSSGPGINPIPLVAGSPVVRVTTGAASFFQPRNPYFSVREDALSDEQLLEAYDSCGNRTLVTGSAKTAVLRAKKYDFATGLFAADAAVGFSSHPSLAPASPLSLDFAVGQSSRSFFVNASDTGSKNIEVFFNLAAPATFYYGFTSLPSNALTGVAVATAPFGVARSSISVFPGDPTKATLAFISFTLGDANLGWRVVVSSVSLEKGGEALWERYGFGQPVPGEIAWDGRFSPWINSGARVPGGTYIVRVEVGAGVKNESLRVKVESPQIRGTVWDRSTSPPSRLADADLDAFGPFGGGKAVSGPDGSYILPGLVVGTYTVFANRTDYIPGQLTVGLAAGGGVSTFSAVSDAVLISTEAASNGETLVNIFMKSPGSLLVTASGVGISTGAFDRWGGLQVRKSTSCTGTSSGETLYAPLRLKAGTTVFDDGGQWDPASQSFVERSFHKFLVSPATFTAEAFFEGFLPSCATGFIPAEGGRIDLAAFSKRSSISGAVTVPSNPAGGQGTFVSVSAVPFSTATAAQPGFGGVFLNAGTLTGTYTVPALDAGTFVLRANAAGFVSIASGPVVLAAAQDLTGFDFPTFGAGASIGGSASIPAAANALELRLFVSAWAPGTLNFGSTEVVKAAGAAGPIPYGITGLSDGATYQVYAHLEGAEALNLDLVEPIPSTKTATTAGAVQNFTFIKNTGVLQGTMTIAGTDFGAVGVFGEITASALSGDVGHTFSIANSTDLPGFACVGGALAGGNCPGSVATFRVEALGTETLDVTFHDRTSGQVDKKRVSVVNGSTTTVTVNLAPAVFAITGLIDNQIANAVFKSSGDGAAALILANAALVPLQDRFGNNVPVGLSGVPVSTASLARIVAIRQELEQFNLAISTSFNPATDRVGYLTKAGSYTISGVPPGSYFVRTANLRLCATCETLVPSVGQIVRVSNVNRSSVNFTLTDGFNVSGTISLASDIQDSRVLSITVFNRRQEVARSTGALLGDAALGVKAGSVGYEFKNLPAGDFYTIVVRDESVPAKYAGRPIKVPDPTSAGGLQKNMTGQDVSLQRAAFITGRLKDTNTGELIGKANAALLAPNFRIAAVANPFVDGGFVLAKSSVAGRPIEADDYFRVGPLIPKLTYDLKLAQTSFDPNFLTQGSQNYAPVTVSGLLPQEGEIKDLGFIGLNQGTSLSGTVRQSSATGALLGNIKVLAKPSFGTVSLTVQSFTNSSGRYTLWVSSSLSSQYDVTAAPRDGNLASNGSFYGEKTLRGVIVDTASPTADFLLDPLAASVTGQVAVVDAATGGELSYPFGDKKGFPAAAINLQPAGIVPVKNPLGDIEAVTDAAGKFDITGLSTGTYAMRVTSLGYAVFKATVAVTTTTVNISTTGAGTPLAGNLIVLERGGSVSGKILKRDGSSPSEEEVAGVAAANFLSGDYVVGSVEIDPTAKTVSAYNLSGFNPGVAYDIVLLPKDQGSHPLLPPEGAGFSVASATTSLSDFTLSYPTDEPDCTADATALGNSQFQVKIECTDPLRKETSDDDAFENIVYVSSTSSPNPILDPALSGLAAGSIHAFPKSGGRLLGPDGEAYPSERVIEGNRKKLTLIYRATSTAETVFSLHLTAYMGKKNEDDGSSFLVDKIFDFFTGLDSGGNADVSNISGGEANLEASDKNKDQKSKVAFNPGSFKNTSGGAVCASCTVTLGIVQAPPPDLATSQVLGSRVRVSATGDVAGSIPKETEDAVNAYKAQSSKGAMKALSFFYSLFLPLRYSLSQPADLTLSFAASQATDTSKVDVYFYNFTTGKYQLESNERRLDTANQTITVKVDHFSTFIVSEGAPSGGTVARTFGGTGIEVATFPNPADCITHTGLARNAFLGAGGNHDGFVGPMIRYSIPSANPARAEAAKISIYNTAGERIRIIDQGEAKSGTTSYQAWDCRNESGRVITSGVYIGEVTWGKERKLFKMAIIKGSGL